MPRNYLQPRSTYTVPIVISTLPQRAFIRDNYSISYPSVEIGDTIWVTPLTAQRYGTGGVRARYTGHRPTLDPLPLPE